MGTGLASQSHALFITLTHLCASHTAVIITQQYQIQPSDLYNSNEINFFEGQGQAQDIITKYPEK